MNDENMEHSAGISTEGYQDFVHDNHHANPDCNLTEMLKPIAAMYCDDAAG
jgi:hypothetical protein